MVIVGIKSKIKGPLKIHKLQWPSSKRPLHIDHQISQLHQATIYATFYYWADTCLTKWKIYAVREAQGKERLEELKLKSTSQIRGRRLQPRASGVGAGGYGLDEHHEKKEEEANEEKKEAKGGKKKPQGKKRRHHLF